MASANLAAKLRTERGKSAVRKLRAIGRIPAVLYGHGDETRSITVDAHELERLFAHIHKENTIINLAIEGASEVKALVREVQSHAFRDIVFHVDFYQVHAGEQITVEVPIRLVGTPAGVKLGGLLQRVMDEVECRCLPDQIPEAITIDVSALEIGDSIHVRDLPLPEGVVVQVEGDRTVLSITPPQVVAVEPGVEAVEVATSAEPEVIRRKKEDEA